MVWAYTSSARYSSPGSKVAQTALSRDPVLRNGGLCPQSPTPLAIYYDIDLLRESYVGHVPNKQTKLSSEYIPTSKKLHCQLQEVYVDNHTPIILHLIIHSPSLRHDHKQQAEEVDGAPQHDSCRSRST